MLKKLTVFTFVLLLIQTALGSEPAKSDETKKCNITYFSRRAFYNHSAQDHAAQKIEKNINESAKKAFEVADKIDRQLWGLVSMVFTGGKYSLEQVTTTEWSKVILRGDVLYSDAQFTSTPLKGTRIVLEEDKTQLELTTATDGSFQENLYKLIPYKRLRLFPFPIFEMGSRRVPTFKIPFRMTVYAPDCVASTEFRDLPLETNVFVISPSKD